MSSWFYKHCKTAYVKLNGRFGRLKDNCKTQFPEFWQRKYLKTVIIWSVPHVCTAKQGTMSHNLNWQELCLNVLTKDRWTIEDRACVAYCLSSAVFSRQLDCNLFEAEDQNTTFNLVTSDIPNRLPQAHICIQWLSLHSYCTPLLNQSNMWS